MPHGESGWRLDDVELNRFHIILEPRPAALKKPEGYGSNPKPMGRPKKASNERKGKGMSKGDEVGNANAHSQAEIDRQFDIDLHE